MNAMLLERRARRLSYFTLGYNFLEGLISVIVGAAAGSVALVGFGLDSFVESLSGGIMIWRFRDRGAQSHEERERIERRALHLVGYTFYLLGAYVLYDSVRSLYLGDAPRPTGLGIGIAIASLIVMPVLFVLKRRTAQQLGSQSLRADSRQTLACVMLSVALLVGLTLNAMNGWWQADPLIGLVIGGALLREGKETIETGKMCSC